MKKGYFACEILGTPVEKSIADKFRENLGDIDPTDAIEWFIYQVATGEMKIQKEQNT